MQIDFKALEQALAPIEEIGQGELTFDAGGIPVTLRILTPVEELAVQRHGAVVFEGDGKEDANSAVEYLDRFRTATLSYSIIQVGGADFRGVEFVTTGDTLDNGTEVKITKPKALQQLIARWSRAILVRCFHKYSELLETVEAKAEKAVVFVPTDHDAEIDRLTAKLADLNAAKRRQTEAEQEAFSAKVRAVAAVGQALAESGEPEADSEEPEVNPEQVMPVAKRTGPVSPQQAPPPPERKGSPPLRPSPEQPLHRPPPRQADSSFINTDDEDGINAALDAEHNRIAAMRRRAAEGVPQPDEGSGLQQMHPQMGGRRPPHLDAREAEEDIGVLMASQQAARTSDLEGTPVLDLPAQDLGVQAPPKPGGRVTVNPVKEAGGSLNPRFTPRKQP